MSLAKTVRRRHRIRRLITAMESDLAERMLSHPCTRPRPTLLDLTTGVGLARRQHVRLLHKSHVALRESRRVLDAAVGIEPVLITVRPSSEVSS